MHLFRLFLAALGCCALAGAAQAAPTSYLPDDGIERFLLTHFDLATIRSSLGPRRTTGTRTFADLKMVPTRTSGGILAFDEADWLLELRIVGRGDANKDGVEDLEVCFTDEGRQGATYRAQKGLLITRYAADGYVVALSYDTDACERAAQQDRTAGAQERVPPHYERIGRLIYGFQRLGVSVDVLREADAAHGASPELAARAQRLVRRFDELVASSPTAGSDEIEAALNEAAAVRGLIVQWRGAAAVY